LEIAEYILVRCRQSIEFLNTADYKNFTGLHSACKSGNHDIVALLLDQPAVVNNVGAKTCHGDTPLHLAACHGDARMIRLLLDRAGDGGALALLKDQNLMLQTALHSAVEKRHGDGPTAEALVQELTKWGADISFHDLGTRTPFDAALKNGATKLCRILLNAYRDQVLERKEAISLSIPSSEKQCTKISRKTGISMRLCILFVSDFLLARLQLVGSTLCYVHSFDTELVRSRNPITGFMPVHVACSQGAPVEILQILVNLDPEALQTPSRAGALPLHLACSRGRADLCTLQYLVDHGGVATLRARDREGALPLHRLLGAKRKRPGLDAVSILLRTYVHKRLVNSNP